MSRPVCNEVPYMTSTQAAKAVDAALRRALFARDGRVEIIARYCTECAAIHLRTEVTHNG